MPDWKKGSTTCSTVITDVLEGIKGEQGGEGLRTEGCEEISTAAHVNLHHQQQPAHYTHPRLPPLPGSLFPFFL